MYDSVTPKMPIEFLYKENSAGMITFTARNSIPGSKIRNKASHKLSKLILVDQLNKIVLIDKFTTGEERTTW